jgi:hemoglobin/transferrin/lactoferrin receptor protein
MHTFHVRSLPRSPRSAALALALTVASLSVSAQDASAPAPADRRPGELGPVIVSADRLPREQVEVTATVTALDAEQIETRFVSNIRDLVRNEPGVVVRRAPARFGAALGSTGRDGNTGFNIRGLDGNRVLVQVDGVRVPAAFSFGASSFGRGAYLDFGAVRAVEIVRGPVSSLYGSDGVAGAVSVYTFDPADLLGERDWYASASALYAGEDDGTAYGLRSAARLGERHEVLAVLTHRTAGALDNFGANDAPNSTRTAPNPQDFRADSGLAKWVVELGEQSRLRTTLERVEERMTSDVLSARTPSPTAPTAVLRLDAHDTTERTRASVDGEFGGLGLPVADRVTAALYWQDSETRQFSAEDRLAAADRTRDNRYAERVYGLNLQADREFAVGALGYRVVYGADASLAEIANLRDGTVPPPGERFPNKAFPDTDYDLYGVFAQAELGFGDSGVFLTPGLRWDRYSLEPTQDPQFPGTAVALDGDHVSPKVALRWAITPALSTYANWSEGFRPPTPGQVNNGFTNLFSPGFAYVSIGNPDLRPERSETLELGLRGESARLSWAVAYFDASYRDFIEQVVVGGTGAPTNPQRFQFVNLTAVEVDGFEARATWRANAAWTLALAYAQTDGRETGDDVPLNSVQPPTFTAGVDWSPLETVRASVYARHAREKSRSDVDSSGLPGGVLQFVPAAHTAVDLTARWRVRPKLEIGAGVYNLFDEKYWNWADVPGQPVGSPVIDAYTQPGRSYSARLRYTF